MVFKKEKIITISMIGALFLGAFIGAVYMASTSFDDGLYEYLSSFFTDFKGYENKFSVFLNSFFDNLRVFLIMAVCGFFKFGPAGIFALSLTEGFISGFTTSAFIRYYSLKGLLVPLASFTSTLIFLPTFLFFGIYSANFSQLKKTKNDYFKYLGVALISFGIFCISSLMDGYLSTTFMNLLRGVVVKI